MLCYWLLVVEWLGYGTGTGRVVNSVGSLGYVEIRTQCNQSIIKQNRL